MIKMIKMKMIIKEYIEGGFKIKRMKIWNQYLNHNPKLLKKEIIL